MLDVGSYSKQLTKGSSSNFYYAFLFLPKEKRDAIHAVYAFCRHLDDIVDENPRREEAEEQLKRWREELDRCFRGEAAHPITVKLEDVLRCFTIPKGYFELVVDGVEMDLRKVRYETFEELYEYCYRVASAVGLICIEIFGYESPTAKAYAENLGVAFQLTNIMRDLATDAMRGRIYLPQIELRQFGYREEDLLKGRYNAPFVELMRFQASRAKEYFRKAEASLAREDRPSMLAAEIMRGIYYQLLQEIEGTSYNVFERKITLPKSRRFLIALHIWLRSMLLPDH
ncbi:MAG: presqualene diphosphate synthase HpnD [candidate division NC10 bacterium]|nr:presqualene diphosphate synthase HpnD [candidate division NC10 bacterium]